MVVLPSLYMFYGENYVSYVFLLMFLFAMFGALTGRK